MGSLGRADGEAVNSNPCGAVASEYSDVLGGFDRKPEVWKTFGVNFGVKILTGKQEEKRNGKAWRKYQETERRQVGRAL